MRAVNEQVEDLLGLTWTYLEMECLGQWKDEDGLPWESFFSLSVRRGAAWRGDEWSLGCNS